MMRVYKFVALLVAILSFSKENAFAMRPYDYDGFRSMCARKAFQPHNLSQKRRAITFSMHSGMHASLYVRRACVPLLIRMGVAPRPFWRPGVRVRMAVPVHSAPLFPRRVVGVPLVMRMAYSPVPVNPRRVFWYRIGSKNRRFL